MKSTVRLEKLKLIIPLMFAFLIMLLPLTALAATPSDLDGHWAKGQITDWIDQGLINGYPDGTFKPDSKITRAEFMVLVNGAFGFSETADINYTDVKAGDWYSRAVAQASAAGYISGYSDGSVKPNDPISRQEAAVVIMKVKKLALSEASADKFSDAGQIPAWSKGAVGSAAAAGIMGGYPDGTFKASNLITRAEAVAALSKAVNGSAPSTPADDSKVYDVAGTYGPQSGTETIDGNVTISISGITLQNMVINGDLIIDKSVAQGNAALKKVVVKGNTYIYGGGVNSIYFIDSQTGKTYVAKDDGPVRIVVSGTTDIDQLIAQNSCSIQELNLTGEGVDNIVVSKTHDGEIIINIVYASVENIEVNSKGVTIITGRDTAIGSLTANYSLKVTGNGTIERAVINASGVSLAVKPQSLDVAEGIAPPVITSTTSAGGGGGGGGTPSVSVNAISDVNLIEGAATTTQTVTTTPADAIIAAVSSSTDVAAVDVSGHNISITAGVPGTSTITVTASKSGYTNGTRTFLVNVMARAVSAVAVKTDPDLLNYLEGQNLDLTGLEATLTYNDASSEDVVLADFAAKGITTDPAHGAALSLADDGQPVVLTCNGHTANTSSLTVAAKEVISIAIKTQPSDLNYLEGQSLDLTGLAATLTYNDASTEDVDSADFVAKGITASPAVGTVLTIASHDGISITLTCNGHIASTNSLVVAAREPVSVSVKTPPTIVNYYDGQSLNLNGLAVTVTYNDDTSEDVALTDFAAYGITLAPVNGATLTPTDTAVTISINGKTTSQAIAVTQRVLTADTTLNDVDHDIDITFTADAAFEAAITGVSFNGTALTVTTDYVVSSGVVTLKPSGGNLVLRTPATGNVIITATGYADATVEQTITAGAANSITVTTQAVPGANNQAFATQPVITIKDKYNNVCVNGPAATRSIYATSLNGAPGSWSMYGTLRISAVNGVAAYTDLQCSAYSPGTGSIMFELEGTPYYKYSSFTLPNIEITSFKAIADIDAGIAGDAAYTSAAEVQAVLPTSVIANPNNVSVPVTSWTDTDGYDPSTPGSYTFTAVLGAIPTGYANTGGHTAAVEAVVTSPAKTVTVGALTGGGIAALTAASGRTYPVTTEYIADGQTASITWYGDTNKTSNNNTPPPGINIEPAGSLTSNALTLNVTVTAESTIPGQYFFTVIIDGTESEVKTLTVGNGAAITGAHIDDTGSKYEIYLVITGLSHIAADSVFDPTQLVVNDGSGSSYQLTGSYSAVSEKSSMAAETYYYNGTDTLSIALTMDDINGLGDLPGLDLLDDTLTALEGWNISNEVGAGQISNIPITNTTI